MSISKKTELDYKNIGNHLYLTSSLNNILIPKCNILYITIHVLPRNYSLLLFSAIKLEATLCTFVLHQFFSMSATYSGQIIVIEPLHNTFVCLQNTFVCWVFHACDIQFHSCSSRGVTSSL